MSPVLRGPVTIGLDVGGTKIFGVVLDGDDEVVTEAKFPTPNRAGGDAPRGPETLAESLAHAVSQLSGSVASGDFVLESVGVGVPGLVDDAGVLRFAPNLLYAKGMHVHELLSPLVSGVPVVAENDANCAALAETTCGAATGEPDAVVLTLGTGIGAGIVAGGSLLRGANGFAGEIGHIVVDASGPQCPCGRRGCWERYASGSGVEWMAKREAGSGRLREVLSMAGGSVDALQGDLVTRAALSGDGEAIAVLEEVAWWLALGLANLAAVLDTKLFVVGGGLMEAGEVLLDPARAAFAEMVEGREERPEVRIVAAALGARAGAIGAALAARSALSGQAALSDQASSSSQAGSSDQTGSSSQTASSGRTVSSGHTFSSDQTVLSDQKAPRAVPGVAEGGL